jgi:hypothetical protein
MKQFSLKYTLLTHHLDQIWLPAALWIGTALLISLFDEPARQFALARGYLGLLLPLIGGVTAAHAVLDDAALELRFASPLSASKLLMERFTFVFAVQCISGMLLTGFALIRGVDFSSLGTWTSILLAWFIPTLSLTSLGFFSALLGRQPMNGVFVVGLVWIVELIVRESLMKGAGAYWFVFLGLFEPGHASLEINRFTLLILSVLMLFASGRLLRKQERYI